MADVCCIGMIGSNDDDDDDRKEGEKKGTAVLQEVENENKITVHFLDLRLASSGFMRPSATKKIKPCPNCPSLDQSHKAPRAAISYSE